MHADGAVTILRRSWASKTRGLSADEDATSADKTTQNQSPRLVRVKPRGAVGTSARKMGERGRLARCQEPRSPKCQAAGCERVGATLLGCVT